MRPGVGAALIPLGIGTRRKVESTKNTTRNPRHINEFHSALPSTLDT